jgi:hypothetical protein
MQLKITIGTLQVEYDGDESFFKSEVIPTVEKLGKFVGSSAAAPAAASGAISNKQAAPGSVPKHSTNTVAKLIAGDSGPDLIMAAVAKKIIVDGQKTVTRSEITKEMRAATSYYKKTYTNNLSAYLDTLTKADKLRLVANDEYGLPAKARDELEPKLYE